jgi:hypothetical protein
MTGVPEVAMIAAAVVIFEDLTTNLSPGDRATHWSERAGVYRAAARDAILTALPYQKR